VGLPPSATQAKNQMTIQVVPGMSKAPKKKKESKKEDEEVKDSWDDDQEEEGVNGERSEQGLKSEAKEVKEEKEKDPEPIQEVDIEKRVKNLQKKIRQVSCLFWSQSFDPSSRASIS
jgi:hypothetical protein